MNESSGDGQCILYVIQVKSGAVKIGVSTDLETRLKDIQAYNHEKIKVTYTFTFDSFERARHVEVALHKRYSDKRIHHEWFTVNADAIIQDIEFATSFLEGLTGMSVSRPGKRLATERFKERARTRLPDAREQVRRWLTENPDDLALNVRDLAAKVGVGKSTVAEVKSAMLSERSDAPPTSSIE